MTPFREKAQVFIIGLTIGLLIAGAFFILKLDDYFKELSIYKKVTQTFSSQPETPESTEVKTDEEKEPVAKTKKIKIEAAEDKTEKAAPVKEQVMDADTMRTVRPDSASDAFAADDNIVVRKDELLMAKTLDVTNLNPLTKPTAKDSLLQKVSGIKDDKTADRQMFNVEFWESPLHYKGYKLSKYKMVLYGFASAEGLKIYKLDDSYYLRTGGLVYRLDYTTDFKPYERITDEQIISRLK